jgi:hypothetical protein
VNARRIPYKDLISALFILTLPLFACGAWRGGHANANELAIGKRAKINSTLMIPITGAVELDWKTRDEVLGLREHEVRKYPQLLYDDYQPSECFDLIEDHKPWWGLWGLHVYRQGQHAIDGPSKESEYLLNPFRLVAAECNNIGIFKENAFTERELQARDFPFIWQSGPVKFDARNCIAQVTYDVTGYHRQLAKLIPKLKHDVVIQNFSLIAYNARDFSLPFMYLDTKNSINVTPWERRDCIEIPQMLHCGGSCGYPGGCNNMSPHRPELDQNHLKKLPARAVLKLYSQRPRDPEVTPADFTMVLDFI